MNIIQKLFSKRSSVASLPFNISYGTGTSFNVKHPVALSCIDLISSSIASLPIDLIKKGSGKDTKHPLYSLLKQPNYDETPSLFFYALVQDYFKGNIYLYKYKNSDNEVVSLFRISPDLVVVKNDLRKVYAYNGKEYSSDTILHIPSRYGYNGLVGQSIFNYYSDAFALVNGLYDYYNNSFRNGFGGGKRIVLDVSKLTGADLTSEKVEELKQKFLSEYSGVTGSGKPIIKTKEEVNYTTLDVGSETNREKQLVENIAIAEQLICKLFNVPVSLLNGKNEYGNIESLYQVFIDFAVKPIADNIADGLSSLLTPSEKNYLYLEPNYNSLKRTDLTSRIEAYVKQLNNAILTPNEVRAMEGKEPVNTAGDNLFLPANLLPLTQEIVDARLAQQKVALEQVDKYTDKKAEAIDDSTK